MAWTKITRRKYLRDWRRYTSDLTAMESALIEPLPPPAWPLGRPRETDPRAVANATPVYGRDWLPVAVAAEGVPALFDGAWLFPRLDAQRHFREHQRARPKGPGERMRR